MDKRAKHCKSKCFESRNVQLRKPTNNSNKSKFYFYCIFVYFVLSVLFFTALLLDNFFTHSAMPVKAVTYKNCLTLDLNLDEEKNLIEESALSSVKLGLNVSPSTKFTTATFSQCTSDMSNYAWANSNYVVFYVVSNWSKSTLSLEKTREKLLNFESNKRKFLRFDILLPNSETNVESLVCKNYSTSTVFVDNINSIEYYGIVIKAIWQDASEIILENDGELGGESKLYAFTGEIPSIDSVAVPTKQGYKFLGYYDGDIKYINEDGTLVKDELLYETLPTSLSAKWEADSISYTISLINDNESFCELQVNNGIVQNDSIIPPLKNGYRFLGFYDDNGTMYIDSNGNIDQSTQLYANIISKLYAQYEIVNYDIIYLNIDGTPLDNNNLNNPNVYTIETKTFTLLAPIAPNGYKFKGWSTDKLNYVQDYIISEGTFEDIILYAHFEADSVNVVFNCENYSNQAFMIFVYLNGKICYQYVVESSSVIIALEDVDYSTNTYSFRFVSGYMSLITISPNDNITKISSNLLELNTLTNTNIDYSISIVNFNSFIV